MTVFDNIVLVHVKKFPPEIIKAKFMKLQNYISDDKSNWNISELSEDNKEA